MTDSCQSRDVHSLITQSRGSDDNSRVILSGSVFLSSLRLACLLCNLLLTGEGFTSHSIQDRSFRKRAPSQTVGLVWKN